MRGNEIEMKEKKNPWEMDGGAQQKLVEIEFLN